MNRILIKNGEIHNAIQKDGFTADILIENGKISQIHGKSQKVGGNILISRISDVFKQRVRAVRPVEMFEDDFTMELSINFIIAGMLEVYKVWLQDSKGISLEKLSKGMSTIIFLGLNGVITEGE